ncbi:hypothetical protein N1030_06610 [Desulfovibrio mangrovi]|uniref:Spy/CpxP family protein refolding chaperone n=1 Tax=Desulfovibrio mangrovi TaxID=2976983 RepID=UPI00224632DD|nr:hypothetical protein [Desulfovibrio mangrovi]UZP68638.1 hypothetical protein N1030_06610 [Desulfovibrio mangrovi]
MKRIVLIVFVIMIASAGVASAQPQGLHGPGIGMDRPSHGPRPPCMEYSSLDMLDWLELTPKQKADIAVLLKQQIAFIDKVQAEERPALREEQMKAMRTAVETGDVETVRSLSRIRGEEMSERAVERAKFNAELRKLLSAPQLLRLDTFRERMESRMEKRRMEEGDIEQMPRSMRAEVAPEKPEKGRGRSPLDAVKREMQRWIEENS